MMATKIFKVDVIMEGQEIICPNLITLSMVLGTKSVAGNLKVHNVRRDGGKYIVPVRSIQRRIALLEKRKDTIDDYLKYMKQAIS
jgi:hypothetical protein